MWTYQGNEQPPGEGMNINKMIIWWAPAGKWTGWAGFHISGVLELPENIGPETQPPQATITIIIPVKDGMGCGSFIGQETITFRVHRSSKQWTYNAKPPLPPGFPFDPQ